jgi:hypothetical protein
MVTNVVKTMTKMGLNLNRKIKYENKQGMVQNCTLNLVYKLWIKMDKNGW